MVQILEPDEGCRIGGQQMTERPLRRLRIGLRHAVVDQASIEVPGQEFFTRRTGEVTE